MDIETTFSTNIQASNKGRKNYCFTARKKNVIHGIYIYIFTKTNTGLQKTCKVPHQLTHRQCVSVYHKIKIIYRAYTIVKKYHVCNPKTCTKHHFIWNINLLHVCRFTKDLYMFSSLAVLVTHNGVEEEANWGFGVVVNYFTKERHRY